MNNIELKPFRLNLQKKFDSVGVPSDGPVVSGMLNKFGLANLDELQHEVDLIRDKKSNQTSHNRTMIEALYIRLMEDVLELEKLKNEAKG